uniref:Uncharacterized protein n=1 Tax=Meloidogyne incognita TaxID=6306 RepID=A0A914LS38_MELIC
MNFWQLAIFSARAEYNARRYLYRTYGPRTIWIMESIEVGIMILFWLLCYRRLVPLNILTEMDGNGKENGKI